MSSAVVVVVVLVFVARVSLAAKDNSPTDCHENNGNCQKADKDARDENHRGVVSFSILVTLQVFVCRAVRSSIREWLGMDCG